MTWAFSAPIHSRLESLVDHLIRYPLLVVGSGGSLSSSHFAALVHEKMTGKIAHAITPLEFVFSAVNPAEHAVLFLTAGGGNKDIIDALTKAIQSNYSFIGIVCAQTNSKISKIIESYPHVQLFEYPNPAVKDGFLAVNSLLSTCILIARAYKALDLRNNFLESLLRIDPVFDTDTWNSVLQRQTIVALGAGWAWPALVDLESKFSEAGLGSILLTDFRNFAHGRHNWFDKKGDESSLLVLETPSLTLLCRKTAGLLPAKYPKAILSSHVDGPQACLHFYIQIFHLVNEVGKRQNIDPGKPSVAEFGRKLYHLGISPAISIQPVENKWAGKYRASGDQ
ncbi:MAG: hypothetical protein KAW12_18405 [Candidatus Aminicenantes bacterium]|nr:hypothetical protein [Candidatus Aminicenantes bacterium]